MNFASNWRINHKIAVRSDNHYVTRYRVQDDLAALILESPRTQRGAKSPLDHSDVRLHLPPLTISRLVPTESLLHSPSPTPHGRFAWPLTSRTSCSAKAILVCAKAHRFSFEAVPIFVWRRASDRTLQAGCELGFKLAEQLIAERDRVMANQLLARFIPFSSKLQIPSAIFRHHADVDVVIIRCVVSCKCKMLVRLTPFPNETVADSPITFNSAASACIRGFDPDHVREVRI